MQFDAENTQQIGWVSQYGDTSKSIIQTRTEGVTGVTGGCEGCSWWSGDGVGWGWGQAGVCVMLVRTQRDSPEHS